MNKDYFNSKGILCGYLIDGVYRKHVKASKHLLRTMQAWGIDKTIVEDLKLQGATTIRIKDDESGHVYECSLEDFTDIGVERDFGERQIFLPLRYWKIEE